MSRELNTVTISLIDYDEMRDDLMKLNYKLDHMEDELLEIKVHALNLVEKVNKLAVKVFLKEYPLCTYKHEVINSKLVCENLSCVNDTFDKLIIEHDLNYNDVLKALEVEINNYKENENE